MRFSGRHLIMSSVLLAVALASHAQEGNFGLGVMLGNPTGISAVYWTGEYSAIQASLGYNIARQEHLLLSSDFLYHPWTFIPEEDMIRPYFGLGAGLGFISDLSVSLRLPLGSSYFFSSIPLEAFAELDPTLQLMGPGNVRFFLGGYLGARWYF